MNTILVIDDNPAIGENTVELLEVLGYRSWLAPNGQMGLDLIKEKNPDLVLCDIVMPGLDGYDVLHAVRANPSFARLPFYFMSARTEPVDQQKGVAMRQ